MTDAMIDAIFEQLDRDRHLAGYPLEERASPFFKLFLPEMFKSCFNTALNPIIIPEFPYLRNCKTNQSPKVDFFAVSKKGDKAFLIELKTDMDSLKKKQAEDLAKASRRGLKSLVQGVVRIGTNPNTKQGKKYRHLLEYLSELSLVEIPDGAYKRAREKVRREIEPKIIYILPNCNPTHGEGKQVLEEIRKAQGCIVTFEKFADLIKEHGPIGKRFARSLTCWADVPAGSVPPGTPCP